MILIIFMVLIVIDLFWMNWLLMWVVYFCCVGFSLEIGFCWGVVVGSSGSGEIELKLC